MNTRTVMDTPPPVRWKGKERSDKMYWRQRLREMVRALVRMGCIR